MSVVEKGSKGVGLELREVSVSREVVLVKGLRG